MKNALNLCGLWFVLVGLAIIGRFWQPSLNVTPMAGVALAAGSLFPNPVVAASVPLCALALSNLFLPAYGTFIMAAVVYAATAWPVVLGGVVRSGRLKVLIGSALACSLVFFLTTNFTYFCLSTDYPHTLGGLLACYAAALPFYRWMPVGDVVWSLAIFGTGSLMSPASRWAPAAWRHMKSSAT